MMHRSYIVLVTVGLCVLMAASEVLSPVATYGQHAPSSAAPTGPEPAPSAEISRTLNDIITTHNIPGMVAAIVAGDGSIEIGCAGVRKRSEPQPITIHDRMHIGSCTKSMTATMIATLVEDGTISFDTTISQVFGDPNGTMHEDWRNVTLHQLLTNRSGAPADLNKDNLWQKLWMHSGDAPGARMLLVEGVLRHPPEVKPGTRNLYSNAGFAVAGAMAEKATGKSWEQLMRTRLFEPLGMSSAGFGAPGNAASLDQPRGHTPDGKAVEPGRHADNPVAIGPAGIVHCSVLDWGRYVAMHVKGAQGEDAGPLKAASFKMLHTPASESTDAAAASGYAMGWAVMHRPWAGADTTKGGRTLTHNGSNTMWFAVMWLAPERDFAVVVACNQGGDVAAKACDDAAGALIRRHQSNVRDGK